MKTSFYSSKELKKLGLVNIGKNVLISRKTSLYGASNFVIGDNVRIDDFCVLSGNIVLGSYIHIAVGVYLFGTSGIIMEDFSAISSRSVVYSATDDYGGEYATNPMCPEEYRHVICGKVHFKKHVIVGTGTTILPGVTLEEGAGVGAMSLVKSNLDPWSLYVGVPAKFLKFRLKDVKYKLENYYEG